jgi:hypothetical protein
MQHIIYKICANHQINITNACIIYQQYCRPIYSKYEICYLANRNYSIRNTHFFVQYETKICGNVSKVSKRTIIQDTAARKIRI